jgi:ATP-dependent DNA ligase
MSAACVFLDSGFLIAVPLRQRKALLRSLSIGIRAISDAEQLAIAAGLRAAADLFRQLIGTRARTEGCNLNEIPATGRR